MTVDVYNQFFAAKAVSSGVERRAALVALTADSCEGVITYEILVTLFPHRDEEDYAVSYDACATRKIFSAKGRRSKKREKAFLEALRPQADKLAGELGGEIFWEQPLRDANYG